MKRHTFVIYSDLDGCLLDRESYRFEAARPALEHLKGQGIPVVLCSSKTQAEVEFHREILGLPDPFIVENGGAILIPEGYFPAPHAFRRSAGVYGMIELGVPYARLTRALHGIRHVTGFDLRGFAGMSPEEVALLTGLDLEAARRAKARRYDEPFVADLNPQQIQRLTFEIRRRGLILSRGGRFYHLTGRNTKGLAVVLLTLLYRSNSPDLITVGLGDGPNDLSMLERVDFPVVIPRERFLVDTALMGRPWRVAPAPGPAGWAAAIQAIMTGRGTALRVA
ncbi:MAG: HAD-IIB family hydrolase [candidate division NC10 bacterium]|nr:HAD-IIB family hydrolase [candidate division NC10 bacterium]